MAGGITGTVSVDVKSCVKVGDSYNVTADFYFHADTFDGASNPYLVIHSDFGFFTEIQGSPYGNDPLTTTFTIKAIPRSVLTITMGYWNNPAGGAEMASILEPIDFYTIPEEIIPTSSASVRVGSWGSGAWGSSAWGGLSMPNGVIDEKDITGVVSIARKGSNSVSGRVWIKKTVPKTITGSVNIKKAMSKTINGAMSIYGTYDKSIDGNVFIDNPSEVITSQNINGVVDIARISSTDIDGMMRVQHRVETSVEGSVNILNKYTSTISGSVDIENITTKQITGTVKIRVVTPQKLPEDWEYGEDPEAENWEKTDKDADEWKTTEKLDDEWHYPLEDIT